MKTLTDIIYLAFAALLLACFSVLPAAQAVSPPPDGGYPGNNTAEGQNALVSWTNGVGNTAIGDEALFSNSTGVSNIATGFDTLYSNTIGNQNAGNGQGHSLVIRGATVTPPVVLARW